MTGVRVARSTDGDLRPRLGERAGQARREQIDDQVLRETARVLRVSQTELDPSTGLFDLGMDSLMAIELRSRLEKVFDLKLPATLTFNYPSVKAIGGYLGSQLIAAEDDSPDAADRMRQAAEADQRPAMPLTDATADPDRVPAELDDLSETELANLLSRTLAEWR